MNTKSTTAKSTTAKSTTASKKTKKQTLLDDRRISRIYGQRFHGVQVPILSTPRICAAGQAALDAGGDDEAIAQAMAVIVDQVRVNS